MVDDLADLFNLDHNLCDSCDVSDRCITRLLINPRNGCALFRARVLEEADWQLEAMGLNLDPDEFECPRA